MNPPDESDLDWPQTVDLYRQFFADLPATTRRIGGNNFMTNEVLGAFLTHSGAVVEVSTGEFLGDRIFGVTVRPDPDGASRMCESLAEARALVNQIRAS